MPKTDKPPAIMFYVDDFASDGVVEAMTTEGVGAYILLLCKAWRESPPGTLPDDDVVLARWSRLTPDRWTEVRSSVLAAFKLGKDGRWHQARMEREWRKLVRSKTARSESARQAATTRWHTTSMRTHCVRNANAMPTEYESEDEAPNEFELFWSAFPRGRKKSKGRAREAFRKALAKKSAAELIAAAEEYAASEEGRGAYVKMPATWLNGECWSDDREAWKTQEDASRKVLKL